MTMKTFLRIAAMTLGLAAFAGYRYRRRAKELGL
jgi:hypothetical protein